MSESEPFPVRANNILDTDIETNFISSGSGTIKPTRTPKCKVIIEIPKGTNRKIEISSEEAGNPIVHDIKKDKRTEEDKYRYVPAIYHDIHHQDNETKDTYIHQVKEALRSENLTDKFKNLYGVNFNEGYKICHYGAIPQTYEDPTEKEDYSRNKYPGDGDPLDVCVLGDFREDDLIKPEAEEPEDKYVGRLNQSKNDNIREVHILGVYPMIDEGEIDYKILACTNDYYTENQLYNTRIHDTATIFGSMMSSETTSQHLTNIELVREWFQYYKYKLVDGKLEIPGVEIGKLLPREDALRVIRKCHQHYNNVKEYNSDSLEDFVKSYGSNDDRKRYKKKAKFIKSLLEGTDSILSDVFSANGGGFKRISNRLKKKSKKRKRKSGKRLKKKRLSRRKSK